MSFQSTQLQIAAQVKSDVFYQRLHSAPLEARHNGFVILAGDTSAEIGRLSWNERHLRGLLVSVSVTQKLGNGF